MAYTSLEAKRLIESIQNILGVAVDGKVGPNTHKSLDDLDAVAWGNLPSNVIQLVGKMSTFGGPNDTGVKPDEGLAAWDSAGSEEVQAAFDPQGVPLFLDAQPSGTTGLARRLNPDSAYIAYRFNENLARSIVRKQVAILQANGRTIKALVADWGPNVRTGRVIDMSPGAAKFLGLQTDDTVSASIS